jgi:NAD(P)-dependent dehydrogenase (short-subunit alcohol dehydrogenase family)
MTVIAGVRTAGDAPLSPRGGGPIRELILDVTEPGEPGTLAQRIGELLDGTPLRALVNNAGIGVGGPLEFVSREALRHQFEVNVFGQVAVTQEVLELLREQPDSRIVFMSSIGSRVAAPFFGPYSASKRALDAVADSWRRELAPWRVGVSVLIVSPVATSIWTKASSSLEELRGSLSPRAVDLYGGALAGVSRYVDTTAPGYGIPVESVLRSVRHAVLGTRPRRTYLVGAETRAAVVASALLPARMFDAVLRARLR